MELQKLYSLVRQAIQKYDMIHEGDRIAVGVSGGKDSLGLLYALAGLKSFYPETFELAAVTVNLGYEGFSTDGIASLCRRLGVEYHVIKTEIARMTGEEGCSLCARLRKGALVDMVSGAGYNKIAYAHTMDDMAETMLMSLIYEGRFSTFLPVTEYEDKGITLIRPYIFVTNAGSAGFANKYGLPAAANPCPFVHSTERDYARGLLDGIEKHAPGARKRIMTAIMNGGIF